MTFEEAVFIPDEEMQKICLSLPAETLARALKGTSPEVAEKVLRNIRPPWDGMIRDMIGKLGPLTVVEAETAQMEIAGIVERCRAKPT